MFYEKITAFLCAALLCSSLWAQRVPLSGTWQFATDRNEKGVTEQWFRKKLEETIQLPGSMAGNNKGDDITLKTQWTGSIYDSSFYFRPSLAKYRTPDNLKFPFWLTPATHYVGLAWYQKEFVVPEKWKGKNIRLFLERVHIQSRLWVDTLEIGKNNSLSTPHIYVPGKLKPGKHILTVCIDNRIRNMNVGPDSHSVTDHTQGNWNGIIGDMYLEALPDVQIEHVQVYPDVKNKLASVHVFLVNHSKKETKAKITVSASGFNSETEHQTGQVRSGVSVKPGDTLKTVVTLPMTDNVLLWDEFHPNLYRLTVKADAKGSSDTRQQSFGMREFTIRGTQFLVNGKPVFLRGTVNNCEFPLTGYPAMDVPAWEKIFRTFKAHGLNHVRYHSWCPPEAAFIAADNVGFYMQPEAPTWPNHGTSVGDGRFIDRYIYDETKRMNQAYGNYASFCMLAAGNEPAGRNQVKYLTDFIRYWKANDTRHVYTGASVAMSWPIVPENEYMIKSGARGLKWTDTQPETVSDYSAAINSFAVPYVTHEMGQWCVFPDFDEIKKYTGLYRARNFELFQDHLADHGMADQAKDFFMASGRLQALCYKAEIEKDLRTAGLAGFQLLGLNDFPGQGTALVGILNAFLEPKPYMDATHFRRFCNATVVLAQLPKFTFQNTEIFEAGVELFHFGEKDLKNETFQWTVRNEAGEALRSGSFDPSDFPRGGLTKIGNIKFALDDFKTARHLNLEIFNRDSSCINDWDFWVYPAERPGPAKDAIYHCTVLDDQAEAVLNKGGKVFLNGSGKVIKGKEIVMHFTPVFWNTSWFKMRPPHITGMLIQSRHPAFREFPTSGHSDFQWWSIANKAQVMHLEDFPKGFKPLVQPIDTWFMNRRLALIMEARVGTGKLVVSSADLSDTSAYPASRQLYYSILKYMNSNEFNPASAIDIGLIKDIFRSPSKEVWDAHTKDSPDELKPKIK